MRKNICDVVFAVKIVQAVGDTAIATVCEVVGDVLEESSQVWETVDYGTGTGTAVGEEDCPIQRCI